MIPNPDLDNKLEIASYVTDGDNKCQKIMEKLKWNENDGVQNILVGQPVVENRPLRYMGKFLLEYISLHNDDVIKIL